MLADQRKIRWRRLRGDGVKLVALLFAPLGEGVLLALVVPLIRAGLGLGQTLIRVRVRELALTLALNLTPNPHLELLGVRVGDGLDLMRVRAGVRP